MRMYIVRIELDPQKIPVSGRALVERDGFVAARSSTDVRTRGAHCRAEIREYGHPGRPG